MNALLFPFFTFNIGEVSLWSETEKVEVNKRHVEGRSIRCIYHRLSLFPTTTVAASAFKTLHTNATFISPPTVARTTVHQLARDVSAQN